MKKIVVCCWCKNGGDKEHGPLVKTGKDNVAHQLCLLQKGVPKISNASFIHVMEAKDIKKINGK